MCTCEVQRFALLVSPAMMFSSEGGGVFVCSSGEFVRSFLALAVLLPGGKEARLSLFLVCVALVARLTCASYGRPKAGSRHGRFEHCITPQASSSTRFDSRERNFQHSCLRLCLFPLPRSGILATPQDFTSSCQSQPASSSSCHPQPTTCWPRPAG